MAKFTPGPAVAEIRGSVGGNTFSQNRFGAYIRRRSVPTISTTDPAQVSKTALQFVTQQWAQIDPGARNAWRNFAQQFPVTDSMGQQIFLTGHQWFVKLNCRLRRIPGPIEPSPPDTPGFPSFLTAVIDTFPSVANIELTSIFPTLETDQHIWVYTAITNSPGKTWVENLYRLTSQIEGAGDLPYNMADDIIARHGSLSPGQTVHLRFHRFDAEHGRISPPLSQSYTLIAV